VKSDEGSMPVHKEKVRLTIDSKEWTSNSTNKQKRMSREEIEKKKGQENASSVGKMRDVRDRIFLRRKPTD